MVDPTRDEGAVSQIVSFLGLQDRVRLQERVGRLERAMNAFSRRKCIEKNMPHQNQQGSSPSQKAYCRQVARQVLAEMDPKWLES